MTLTADSVDAWYADLTEIDVRRELLRRTLSSMERGRAGRFRFERDRLNYERRTYLLRLLLADYSGSEPAQIQFHLGKHGKPECTNFPRIRFNLTHSNGRALYAFRLDGEVGVDLECIRPRAGVELVARSSFTESERQQINAFPGEERLAAFYRCWTLKEAYVKARGEGLSARLDSFEVRVFDYCQLSASDSERWRLFPLPLFPGYVGALCAEAPCFAPHVRGATACQGRFLPL